jgi:uncharacterized membrane protein YphA (DoxX/SURF4 family)
MTIRSSAFVLLRTLLAITYLWVVADRLSILGPIGNAGVVWGNFENFLDYTATLNPWFPRGFSDVLGYLATIMEVILAIMLLLGFRLKEACLLSISLLIVFTFSMAFSLGLNAAFEFIMFTIVVILLTALLYWDTKKRNS